MPPELEAAAYNLAFYAVRGGGPQLRMQAKAVRDLWSRVQRAEQERNDATAARDLEWLVANDLRSRLSEVERQRDYQSEKRAEAIARTVAAERRAREATAGSCVVCAGSCGVCGARMVKVRPQHPHGEVRVVCPTCLADRIDSARRMLDPETYIARASQ